jgi:2-aminoadipate transaminase
MKRSFMKEIFESIDKDTISFAGGFPDESLFPVNDLKEANAKVYDNSQNLQYATSNGILGLREQIAEFYNADGFKTSPKNILITTGSQQALFIIANYFKNTDIIIEKPSYLGAVNVFKMNALSINPVELNYNGINIEEFTRAYEKHKLAYIIPDFQNPTSSLYTQEKREKIAKLVLKTGGYLIEDAPFHELYFEKKLKSISSLIPDNSLHLGSFSKTLLPSLRLGWVRANEDIIQKLVVIKEAVDLQSSSIMQYTVNNYLSDTQRYKCHLQNLRDSYKEKMEFFAITLKKHLPTFEFEKPKGGMFIYGLLKGVDTNELLKKCMKDKVVFVPANQFCLNNLSNEGIRFNFTHTNRPKIEEGLKKIAKHINLSL